MNFVYVADISEIPINTMKLVMVDAREVLIVNVQGKHYALSNKCPHAGGSLSEGKLDGNIIICVKHGAEIDVTTAKIMVTTQDDEEDEQEIRLLNFKGKDERVYKTKIENRGIFVGF